MNANARIPVRQAIRAAMEAQAYTDAGTTPRATLRFLALPVVANFGGKAHGGTVMRWINEAAFACAASWSSDRTRATYSGGIHFYRPISIGDLVEVDARIIHIENGRMHVSTHVRSSPVASPDRLKLTTQCMSIFVDPDDDDQPLDVGALNLRSAEDQRLDAHAQELVGLRAQLANVPKGAAGN